MRTRADMRHDGFPWNILTCHHFLNCSESNLNTLENLSICSWLLKIVQQSFVTFKPISHFSSSNYREFLKQNMESKFG